MCLLTVLYRQQTDHSGGFVSIQGAHETGGHGSLIHLLTWRGWLHIYSSFFSYKAGRIKSHCCCFSKLKATLINTKSVPWSFYSIRVPTPPPFETKFIIHFQDRFFFEWHQMHVNICFSLKSLNPNCL